MASSASLKDLSKAIVAFLPEPIVPLPDDLSHVIDGYLRRHLKYDDAASDRLQEELLSIFNKHVRETPAAFAAWLAIFRQLLPVLRTPERIFAWWDPCIALSAKAASEKGIIVDSFVAAMDVFAQAEEQAESSNVRAALEPLIQRLFADTSGKDIAIAEHIERLTRETIIHFGKRHPKDMFTTLDRHFVQKQYRKLVLGFLSFFIQSQPPHLHQILQTPLFGNILRCLQRDTSTTIISAALTVLIMLLPHMPSSLVPHLPTLFNIYARLLFWSRERSGAANPQQDEHEGSEPWDTCQYEPALDDHQVYHLLNYYTILYGLYPINFMDYIRKPQRYLRHANVANADDIEVQPTEIRDQSESFRRCHLLHPNFYSLTIDSEKTDFSRWIKSEASEVVAECAGLCLANEPDGLIRPNISATPAEDGPSPGELARDPHDVGVLSNSLLMEHRGSQRLSTSASMDSMASSQRPSVLARQGSQSSQHSVQESLDARIRDPSADSPTLPPHLTQSASHTQLQDMIQSNKAIKSTLNQSLANDSVPSLSLSHQESSSEKPPTTMAIHPPAITSPLSMTESNTQVAHLQRRILLLQNDLNFERYLKQQHMTYIGDLRRRQLDRSVTEAETQHLVMTNRSLKNRFDEAKKAEMQVRRDSEKSRAIAKKWEADLANKLKNLRDESKKVKAELENARKEAENARVESEKLRVMLCDAEVKELSWKQNMQAIELHNAERDRLKAEVERLTRVEHDHQAKEAERQVALESVEAARGEIEGLSAQLAARENELERSKRLLQSQIAILQGRLAEAQEGRTRSSSGAKAAVEGALAASREKQAELQKQCNLLVRKYTALQSSLLDMQSGAMPGALRIDTSKGSEAGSEQLSLSASPVTMKTRPHRVLSNPEVVEGTAYNVTPPLGPKPGTPMSGGWQRPGSPMGTDTSGSLSMSPDSRSLGKSIARSQSDLFSGGVQSRVRKDKQPEAGPSGKKDKKTSALRGIRGLVYD